MERSGLIAIFMFVWYLCPAQLQFNSSILLKPGDSLTYHKDVLNIPDISKIGENQSWDFRSVQTPLFRDKRFILSPFFNELSQSGKAYLDDGAGLDYIYVSDNEALQEIGFVLHLENSGKRLPVYYDNPLTWNTSSLSYGKKVILRSEFEFTIDRADLPKQVERDIPKSISSFMIRGIKSVVRHTDAWGTLLLPGETIKVNRVQAAETVQVRIYHAKSGKLIPFFDEEMIRQVIPMPSRFRHYDFFSENYPFLTAQIVVNDKNWLSTIDFQSRKSFINPVNTATRKNDFVLYPNPTYNVAKIYINNRKKGNYSLAIYNIIGKKLWERDINVDGETIIKENFGFLPKGTYLISLLDENGNIQRTTRLIIISV